MKTREHILHLADNLIRSNGFNAFSYQHISTALDIKNAAVHYHFPSKDDLGAAVVIQFAEQFTAFCQELEEQRANDYQKMVKFFEFYTTGIEENKICLIGALSNDFNTLDPIIKEELTKVCNAISDWINVTLQSGQQKGYLNVDGKINQKVVQIMTSLIGGLQLSRIFGKSYIDQIVSQHISELQR